MPALTRAGTIVTALVVALERMRLAITSGAAVRDVSKSRATAPATNGAAIEVPDNNAHALSEETPVPATG
ncbi:unannotated protein [freshwater metagenome]|uniref:Unannotated protein n=1 Tax=freshwater metagenome TaxID=449393 RepID=A0A6J7UKG5_9ZZZZ